MRFLNALVLSLILLSVLLPFAEGQEVAREDEALTVTDEALALAVAAVAFNEAPGYPADLALIWQATMAHGDTSAERLAWLRAHSDCVLSDRPMRRSEIVSGNCRWTRGLTDSDARPEQWPEGWSWSRWSIQWARTREFARRFVGGHGVGGLASKRL